VGPGCQARRGRAQLGRLGWGGEGENTSAGATWARNALAEGGRGFPFSFSIFYFTFPFSIFVSFYFLFF
jgi:hypothetical protein